MGPARQITVAERPNAATQPTIEARIERFTRHQLGLIRADQLLAAGVSLRTASRWVDRGRLHRLHRSVYASHPPPYTRDQRYLAAVLACGPGALLCGLPAAAVQGLTDTSPFPAQISSPSGSGRSRPGLIVHRRGLTDPRDWSRVNKVPCTAPHLTLIELAPTLTEPELETLLVAAESKGLLKRGRLAELIAERRGRPGIGKLERITALEPALTRSDLELIFLPLWRTAGIPRPSANFPIHVPDRKRPLTVDFAWPEIRMVVEADSQRFHGDWERAEIDRERDQLLALAGWQCHRFVRRRIVEGRTESAARHCALVDRRTTEVRSASPD